MQNGKILPQDVDAEEQVLGSMILDPGVIPDVASIVRTDDFYRPVHGATYEVILALYDRGDPVDPVSVARELDRVGVEIPGDVRLWVFSLTEGVAAAASGTYHAHTVLSAADSRRLIEAANRAMSRAYAPNGDVKQLASELAAELETVVRGRDRAATVNLETIVTDTFDIIETRLHEGGLPTGFVDLDRVLFGLHPGNLVVVAARPGQGKSSFVTNICRNVTGRGIPALVVSLEMSRLEIGMRLLCAEAKVSSERVRADRLTIEDWRRLMDAAETLVDLPMTIVDSGSTTMTDIRAIARRGRGFGVIVVDYLQLMPGPPNRNRQEQVADITRSLKLLAKDLDIPVVAVSQLNRNPEGRADKRPALADLRESGAIEQDADVVIFLHRDPADQTGKADAIIAKHRNGPTDVIPLTFLSRLTSFVDYTGREEPS